MPIQEAILYFCEDCKTVALQGGICEKCKQPLQVDFFIPKSSRKCFEEAVSGLDGYDDGFPLFYYGNNMGDCITVGDLRSLIR